MHNLLIAEWRETFNLNYVISHATKAIFKLEIVRPLLFERIKVLLE